MNYAYNTVMKMCLSVSLILKFVPLNEYTILMKSNITY